MGQGYPGRWHRATVSVSAHVEIHVAKKDDIEMHIFELEDIITLLRSKVKRAGGQVAWSKKTGINRSTLYRVLTGRRLPTKKMIKALKLRTLFVSDPKLK